MGNSRGQGPEVGAWERDGGGGSIYQASQGQAQGEGWDGPPPPGAPREGEGAAITRWAGNCLRPDIFLEEGGGRGCLMRGQDLSTPPPGDYNMKPNGTRTPTMRHAQQPGPTSQLSHLQAAGHWARRGASVPRSPQRS